MTEARNQSIDREALREWAQGLCETEHDGETSFGERVQLARATLKLIEDLAEAQGTIAFLRENQKDPTPPWPEHPVTLKVEPNTWLHLQGGKLYLPEGATVTVSYPKAEGEEGVG